MTPPLEDLTWPRHTKRLTVRPLRFDDVPEVFTYRSDPHLARWMSSLPASVEDFAEAILGSGSTLVVEQRGVLVGNLALTVQDAWSQTEVTDQARRTQAELGWWVAPVHQGRGYATEAVAELVRIAFDLGIRRVEAACFAENEASWRVMERVGMRREGLYRKDSLHRDGTWRDGMSYALLAEEWSTNADA